MTDRAAFLSPAAVSELDERLTGYAQESGHQIVVYVDHTTGGVPIEDWAVKAFQRWKVGRKGIDDGLVLFIFKDDHRLRIEVGYGLEDRVPDLLASRIINEDMVPRIRAGDADGAVRTGVDRLIQTIGGTGGAKPAVHKTPAWVSLVVVILILMAGGFIVTHPALAALYPGQLGPAGRRLGRRRLGRWWRVFRRGRRVLGRRWQLGRRRRLRIVVTQARPRVVQGVDLDRVEAAIRSAERRTSGQIRVAVARFYFWGSVRRAADAAFARLRMNRTRRRNAVLLFVAPRLRKFAVIGDAGIHERVSDAFWDQISQALQADFRSGDLTAGLLHAIDSIGDRLAEHFPPDPMGDNELPDRVELER